MGTISRFGAARADGSVGQGKGGNVVHAFLRARSALAARACDFLLSHSSSPPAAGARLLYFARSLLQGRCLFTVSLNPHGCICGFCIPSCRLLSSCKKTLVFCVLNKVVIFQAGNNPSNHFFAYLSTYSRFVYSSKAIGYIDSL